MPKPARHRHGDPQVAQAGVDGVLEEQAEHADRDGADDHQPAHPGVRVIAGHPADERACPVADDPSDVLREIQHHGRFGAQLGHCGERRTRVVAAEEELADDRLGARWRRPAGTR